MTIVCFISLIGLCGLVRWGSPPVVLTGLGAGGQMGLGIQGFTGLRVHGLMGCFFSLFSKLRGDRAKSRAPDYLRDSKIQNLPP